MQLVKLRRVAAFTLIELLVVVSIIALLISILLPSLGRAREQAKSVHCLTRLHDFGTGLASYATDYRDTLPPALWDSSGQRHQSSTFHWGWTELLWSYVYREEVPTEDNFPVQRNIEGDRWVKYFLCKASRLQDVNSGHYRVYLPSWSWGTYQVAHRQPWDLTNPNGEPNFPDPRSPSGFSELRPRLPLLGDANERSYRGNNDPIEDADGDGYDDNDGSWVDPREANESGPDGNRFSDRHYGFTCFLFADAHAEKEAKLREILAHDWNLDGVDDIGTEDVGTPDP